MNIIFILMASIIICLSTLIFVVIFFSRKVVFIDALDLYNKGQKDEAMDKLKNYVMTKKTDIKARELLAKIYLEKSDVANALKEYISISMSRAATDIQKSFAYSNMTEIYFNDHNYAKAINSAGRGLKYNKENVKIYYFLGRIYMIMDKERRAIRMFNEALKYDKANVETRTALAEYHVKEKNFVKARFQYKKILELDPLNDDARYNLARIHYEEEELEEAAKELEYLKDEKGREYFTYRILSEYYLKVKNLDRAENILEKMHERLDIFSDLLLYVKYNLANVYEIREKYEEALKLYKEVKEKNARYRDVEERTQTLMKMIEPEEFEAVMEAINYSEVNYGQLNYIFSEMVEKMGMSIAYKLEDTNRVLSAITKDRYNMNADRFFVQLSKAEEITARDLQKFVNQFVDYKVDNGIFITTGVYKEKAIEYAETIEGLEILDKVHIFDIVGAIDKEDIISETE